MSQAKRVGRNVVITLLTQLVSWGLTFTVTLFVPRYLNDTGLGLLTLAGSIAVILGVLVSLGTNTVLVKEIARNPTRLGSLVVTAVTLRLGIGLALLAGSWFFFRAIGYSDLQWHIVMFAIVAMIVAQSAEVLTSALQGLEDFPRQNAIALSEKFLSSLAAIALVFLKGPIWAFVAVGIFSSSFTFLLSAFAIRMHLRASQERLSLRVDRATCLYLFQAGMPFFTSALFVAIYGRSDALLLSELSSVAAIGWYDLAMRLAGSTMFIPVTVCTTMLPLLTRVYHDNTEQFHQIAQRLFKLMILCVLPIATIFLLAPGRILVLLHYPEKFNNSIPVLSIAGVAIILLFLSQAAGTILIASDRQKVLGKISATATLIGIPLCAACIYASEKMIGNGAVGAVISDVVTEVYLLTAYLLAMPKGVVTREGVLVLARAFIASVPLALLFYFAQGNAVFYLLGVGLLLYVVLCKALHCFAQDDIKLLRSMFAKKVAA